MKKVELVFVPSPGVGHLAATVEMAKLISDRDDRLSVTIFIMKLPFESEDGKTTESVASSIRFITLPRIEISSSSSTSPANFFTDVAKAYTPLAREAVHELMTRSGSVRLAGAAFLGFVLHLQSLHDHHNLEITEFKDSDAELEVPSFVHSVPGKVFPSVVFDKEGDEIPILLHHTQRFRETKGIIVNTFVELESHAINSFSGDTSPPIYPIGPILNTEVESSEVQQQAIEIMNWLNDQPPSSVVFLCFGSMGSFNGEQVREIAHGLEGSGCRFLWSLRQPPPKGKMEYPIEYGNKEEVLPEGFLDRTTKIGKVIGWAPQVAVLAHPAVGGFVSHCGWNSTLESLWYGVPTATWPMYAEQQLNAFQMVKDLELAVEIKIDYDKDKGYIVSSQDIEKGLRQLMDADSEVRKKRQKMQEKSRKAMMDGGSSYSYLGYFIEDMMTNVP
ncbi:UDP-glucose flavonoid 3-O-glucosyltransferase 6 [Vitis vinifera]|uniref:Glycosyltransferase n=1 Tax=Vitis vinifera TaxID=29760 RepID=A0A438G713_VITVI|nr:UDP-glucose flavonoid 3-O-glucosyltransferase 6 [Vitis vinifera]